MVVGKEGCFEEGRVKVEGRDEEGGFEEEGLR